MIEPGADGDPPLPCFSQAIPISYRMWTWRMLTDEVEVIFLAHPVLRIEMLAASQSEEKDIWAFSLQFLHLEIPLTDEHTPDELRPLVHFLQQASHIWQHREIVE